MIATSQLGEKVVCSLALDSGLRRNDGRGAAMRKWGRNDGGLGLPSRYSVFKVHGPRESAVCARYGFNVALKYGAVKGWRRV